MLLHLVSVLVLFRARPGMELLVVTLRPKQFTALQARNLLRVFLGAASVCCRFDSFADFRSTSLRELPLLLPPFLTFRPATLLLLTNLPESLIPLFKKPL